MTVVTVSEEEFNRLLDMLDKPPEPTPALRKLFADHRKRFPQRRGTLTLEDGSTLQLEESYRNGPWYVAKSWPAGQ